MITDKELAIAIPTVFPELFKDAWKHKKVCRECDKCGIDLTHKSENCSPCTVPDPIDINDWNVAMKVVKATIRIVGYSKWIIICKDHTNISRTPLNKATPVDYLRAALLAKGAE